jgi:uncharacterized protein YkwD
MARFRKLSLFALLAVAACSDADGGTYGDGASDAQGDEGDDDLQGDDEPSDDDEGDDDSDVADDDSDEGASDAALPNRDGGTRDGSTSGAPARDAGVDAGRSGDAAPARGDGGSEGGAMSTADAGTAGASGDDVPANEHCAPAATWDMQAASFEERVLVLTNEARAKGHNCDTKGMFAPAAPLTMQPHLRCAARLHSKYMAEKREFAHDQAQTGLDPFERMRMTGYPNSPYGENIAWGQRTPEEVVQGWLESDGHCANIMSPMSTEIGIGYALGLAPASSGGGGGSRQSPYWTQNFGLMRRR